MDKTHYDDFLRLETTTRICGQRDGYYAFEDSPFWGEKGGMPSDKGSINGKEVLDLRWEGDVLYHKVDGDLEDPVHCQVDPETRLINTAAQSALHLLDGFYNRRGQAIVAIGVDPADQWYEIDKDDVTEEELEEAQHYINQAILEDVPVEFSYIAGKDYPDESYQQFDYVRIVRYGELDEQPCGTPHLQSTGQIGSFVILGKEKSSRGTRISFTCSRVTDHRIREYYNILLQLCHRINCQWTELPERVDKLMEEKSENKKAIKEMSQQLANLEADAVSRSTEPVMVLHDKEAGDLRNIANKLVRQEGRSKVLLSSSHGKTNLVIASAEGRARDLLAQLKEKTDIHGGGSPQIVNGQSSLGVEELKKVIKGLL